jgi:plasmid stability protein
MITITIKGIPRETHRELKKRAAAHRRSLNSEVIFVLESILGGVPPGADPGPRSQTAAKKLARRK